jgi:hypothetical protein
MARVTGQVGGLRPASAADTVAADRPARAARARWVRPAWRLAGEVGGGQAGAEDEADGGCGGVAAGGRDPRWPGW